MDRKERHEEIKVGGVGNFALERKRDPFSSEKIWKG